MVLLILAPVKALVVSAVNDPLDTRPLDAPQNRAAGSAAPETLLAPGMMRQSKPLTSFPVLPYPQQSLKWFNFRFRYRSCIGR